MQSNQELLFQIESYLEQYRVGTMKEETTLFFILNAINKLNQWSKYLDRTPEEYKDYLVYISDKNFMDIRYYDSNGFDSNDDEITHWLPLPSPPE
jgi:dTDP-D-glucose 4,6-dehydratase